MDSSLFYKASGNCNLGRFTLSYISCVLIALVLGFLYTVVSLVVPFVYFNILFCLGFSAVLAFVCKALFRFSHNRSKRKQIVQAFIIGFLANYFQWTAYIVYAYNDALPTFTDFIENLSWIVIPENFLNAVMDINSIGLWSFFGVQFQGVELALIWIGEALLIMSGPVLAAITAKHYPFSEKMNRWYPKYTLDYNFESISAKQYMLDALVINPLEAIRNLGYGTAYRYSKVHLYYLPQESLQYISIEKINVPRQGKGKKNIEQVIYNFTVRKMEMDAIMNEFDFQKERLNII